MDVKKTLYDYCLTQEKQELLTQWHPALNEPLTPHLVTFGSKKKVWWRCSRGHEWQASVYSRTNGNTGCPVCAKRKVVSGENDLATVHPELAAQWHPTRNGNITPQSVVAGGSRKVWWLCERGHEWKASVNSRTITGANCPACAGKIAIPGENDLKSVFSHIADEWHPTRNKDVTPQQVTPYSNRKAWWICPLGHEYLSSIYSRTKLGSNCPYCAGRKVLKGFNDLETLEPELAKQWHPELNGEIRPDQVTIGSHKKIWWKCPEGHVWKAVIYSRTKAQANGCAVCTGKVKSVKQQFYEERLEW